MSGDALSLSSRLRVPTHILHHDLHEEAILLNLKSGVYFGLDAVGARIWRLVRQECLLTKVVADLLDEYDVTEERCTRDVLTLVAEMRAHGLVDVVH